MQCGMCVKYAPGSVISNRDLKLETYQKIANSLPSLESLVLNGIGEPLLNPDLVNMVQLARAKMQPESLIGFQTNGLLLDNEIVEQLLNVGLNKLCISVDSNADDLQGIGNLLHQNISHRSPFSRVRTFSEKGGYSHFQLGAEIVLSKDTLPKLPEMIQYLADEGVHFILCSHLLAYQQVAEEQSLFSANTIEAIRIYRKWQTLAAKEDIVLTDLTAKTWISPRRDDEHRLQHYYREMLCEAQHEGVWMNIRKLDTLDEKLLTEWQDHLQEAENVARAHGVELSLPPLFASSERKCKFVEEGAVFIDVTGNVMACHPLWHTQTLYMDGEAKHLHAKSFGSIADQDILSIWNSRPYREFRDAVLAYDYPFCHSCSLGPCPDITGETEPFTNDCFGISVPCGHCLWCFDAIRCL